MKDSYLVKVQLVDWGDRKNHQSFCYEWTTEWRDEDGKIICTSVVEEERWEDFDKFLERRLKEDERVLSWWGYKDVGEMPTLPPPAEAPALRIVH